MAEEVYSFSRLSAFHQCKYAYYKTYYEHSPQVDNAFALTGSLVHELCEKYANGEVELETLADLFDWEFDTQVPIAFPKNKYCDLRQVYYDSTMEFFRTWEGYEGCKILGVESEFKIPMRDYKLRGFIDISFVDEAGRYVLRDYKSSKTISKKDLEHKVRQPLLYSLYFKEAYGRYPDVLQFYTFRNPDKRVVEIPFSEDALTDAIVWANDTVDAIRQEWEYEKSPEAFYCLSLCGHRENCKWGKPFMHYKKKG